MRVCFFLLSTKLGCCLLSLSFLSLYSFADEDSKQSSILDLPALQATLIGRQAQVVHLMRSKQFDKAESLLRLMKRNFPQSPATHYNLACLLAMKGRKDEAFETLQEAIALGFRNLEHLRSDPDLDKLRADKRFSEVLKSAAKPFKGSVWPKFPKPTPCVPKEGQVVLSERNLGYDSKVGMFLGLLGRPSKQADRPIAKGQGKLGQLLREWYEEGTAAGNMGDYYDNHDGDHSNMNFAAFPQLTRLEYDETLRKRNLHNGLQLSFLFSGVVLGNSSTAITSGQNWRSQPRFALTQPNGANRLSLQYLRNHVYFYPEHRDHDVGRNGKGGGHGDVFPANVPYFVVSQGSSGSDRPFMNAFAAMLAALRPETKKTLVRSSLLAPTLQQVFRRSNRMLAREEDYFEGKAHPTVFDASQLDSEKMVRLAHELRPDALPPLARFKVVQEDVPVPGLDFFDFRPHQRLFDTPCASARVFKSTSRVLHFTLDAGSSIDLSGKPLTFRWVVLRGDQERILVEKQDENGTIVRLSIPWHERFPVETGSQLESNRVDVGLFVGNGDHWSAPAFFSVYFPDNQKRVYDEHDRVLSVDYTLDNYVDPLIETPRDWIDKYRYDANGSLLGWDRTIRSDKGSESHKFDSSGRLLVKTDENSSTVGRVSVRYMPARDSRNKVILKQVQANN